MLQDGVGYYTKILIFKCEIPPYEFLASDKLKTLKTI